MKYRITTKGKSVPVTIAICLCCILALIVVGALVGSIFIYNNIISENAIGIMAFVITAIAVCLGLLIGFAVCPKEKFLVLIGVFAGTVFILVSATIVVFDGKFTHIIPGVLAVLSGIIPGLLNILGIFTPKQRRFQFKA